MPHKDLEQKRKKEKEWRDNNLARRLANNARWRADNPDKVKAYARKNKTGWTQEDFDKAWEAQDGKCAICCLQLQPSGVKNESARVDHDHKTGLVRGLLCNSCNVALGHLGDDHDLAHRAAHYLKRKTDG